MADTPDWSKRISSDDFELFQREIFDHLGVEPGTVKADSMVLEISAGRATITWEGLAVIAEDEIAAIVDRLGGSRTED
ncbi:hypothetical protein ABFT23_11725 [Nocardioides sp. C4-1]|uniref:hypothetical protein n=1 Tax=Nocardioides sp. C4-1 TaxID=3151851 RepID=UPI003266AD1F